jgi:hypothetical protein
MRTNEQNTSLPSNLTYHNLCSTIQPPPGTKELLGLNLKFCLASAIPTPNLKTSIRRLAYNIRTELYLQNSTSTTENDYHPQIYIKTTGWNPPPASPEIEDSLTLLEKALKNEIQINQRASHHKKHNNLTKLQNKTLKQLQNNLNFIIKPSDKNLGPAILNSDDYINMVLNEHLLTPAYSQLSKETALSQLSSIQSHLKNLINSNKCLPYPSGVYLFPARFQTQTSHSIILRPSKSPQVSGNLKTCSELHKQLLFHLQHMAGLQNEGSTTLCEFIH